jgi:CheY-like chemotaxis protein
MQLKKFTHDETKVRKYSETIEKSATRGAELASQLLSFARMSKRANAPTDLSRVIDEVVSNCALTFPPTITVERKLDEDLLRVLGDHGELFQVLMNLSGNARDAILAVDEGTRSGRVVIEAHNARIGEDISPQLFVAQGGQCVELSVTDNGTGIPKEIREKIYDPFFTTKERGRGTGLGLSIVYNIIRNHHGTIVVDSEEGKGTTFRIYLPAAQTEPAEMEGTAGGVRSAGRNRTILLVDDEAAMQELGKELLLEQGFQVIIANDGLEAVEIYTRRHHEIALVILDLVMPRMDGGQAYVEMKKINKNIKAFFCTGFISDRVIAGLLEEERLKVISKPFRPDDFVRAVAEVLDSEP